MNTITLYHGSLRKIENFSTQREGMYFTTEKEMANSYIIMQAENEGNFKTEEYGFIYKVEITSDMLEVTDDIDQPSKSDKILFCSGEDDYYRIDNLSALGLELVEVK